jgi:DNA ligase 1
VGVLIGRPPVYDERVLLSALARTSNAVAAVSGRLEKIGLLAQLLRQLTPDEVPIAIAALSGEPRQGRLGVGGAAITKARDVPAAETTSLSLHEMDAAFSEVAAVSGPGSSARRLEILRGLFARATAEEQDFLVRLLFGELRQGALEGVLVEAVARASGVSAVRVRRAAMFAGSLTQAAAAALHGDPEALDRFAVSIFTPVQPMLADSAEDVGEALARLGEAALEYKLDGARVQVHKAGGDVRVFSRNLRDVSVAVPEVVEAARAMPAREMVLDGEVIALRPGGGPLPFQVTMRRFGRRLDADALRRDLPLVPFFFDALALDGASLLDAPQAERFAALAGVAPTLVVPHVVGPTRERAEQFAAEALARGHEGVMAKALGASYAAGSRGSAWLKIKQARTLDLVVLAAEWGSGRRRGWLSNLHLGARDPARNAFVMLGKTFKGMTDAMLVWQTARLLALEIGRDAYTVHVRPELVVEIAFNDLQESPQYPGGLALRFARVKRYREDKRASEADTMETVRAIHAAMTAR